MVRNTLVRYKIRVWFIYEPSTLSTLRLWVMDESWWSRSRHAAAGIACYTSRARNAEIARHGRSEPTILRLTGY